MSSVVVLQARTNSSRLPAKVLLPIQNLPVVVLAAKRAANTGRHVIVVTSRDSTDDALVETLQYHGLAYSRGSLNNTLERFVEALTDYDDATLVFRVTADNVFPDGRLIDEIEADFFAREANYLCCNGEQSGLPYGMSVEAMKLEHLRSAYAITSSAFDQEHVTPYLARQFGTQYFEKYKDLKKGQYRCTIDTLDDYLQVQKVFSGIADVVGISSFDLISRLSRLDDAPLVDAPVRKLVIGGVQFGLDYGIANRDGKPSAGESAALLKTAVRNGVAYIDTARAYGNSEEVIGGALAQGWDSRVHVITKLAPLAACADDASRETVEAFVEASVYQSCVALRLRKLQVLMLHRAQHLDAWGGVAWSTLLGMKQQGFIQDLGVSVQSPAELERVLREEAVTFIQMPFNILDGRWGEVIPLLGDVRSRRKLVVHARSALLQGLLLSDSPGLWQRANVDDAPPILAWLHEQLAKWGRKDVADLCFAYVRSQPWIDGVVVGMEKHEQLLENIGYFNAAVLAHESLSQINATRPVLSERTLNPGAWRSICK